MCVLCVGMILNLMDVRMLYGHFLGHTFTEGIKMSLHFRVYVPIEYFFTTIL